MNIKINWTALLFHKIVQLNAYGQLENGPITLDSQWTPQGIQRLDLKWEKARTEVGACSANVSGEHRYVIELHVASGRFKADAHGQVRSPHDRSDTAGSKAMKPEVPISEETLKNLDDIASARVSVRGSSLRPGGPSLL